MPGFSTTAFWGMTINNYDEKDLAMVQNGYPDYCREIVHTLEAGKETGTPHIQAWVKLQRQQRMSFMRKLFPGATDFKALTNDEYIENTKRYAQKLDVTAQSAAVHQFFNPTGTIEALIPRVCQTMWNEFPHAEDRTDARIAAEKILVRENYRLAKIFVSATYKQMWKQFGSEILSAIAAKDEEKSTHTHTHTQAKKNISPRGITNDASCSGDEEDTEEQDEFDTEDGETITEGDEDSSYEGIDDSGSEDSQQTDGD